LATRGHCFQRAITKEIKQSKEDFVCLDIRHLDVLDFQNHFPTIYSKFKELGYNPETDLIPIVPVAHYQCGGIAVNEFGQTDVKKFICVRRMFLHGFTWSQPISF
jgi:L-aspartate oxidase